MDSKMKKGFTLAEVLITLAIIGVVAALTVPSVAQKTQQHVLYTQFMKMYNTLSTALQLSIAKNGYPSIWAFDSKKQEETTVEYLLPYLKVASECKRADIARCLDYNYTNFSGKQSVGAANVFYETPTNDYKNDGPVIIFGDGSMLAVHYSGYKNLGHMIFVFDTNGPKRPNVVGRDLFILNYEPSESNDGKWVWNGLYDAVGDDGSGEEPLGSNCDSSSTNENNGTGCAGRLLLEHKMDY